MAKLTDAELHAIVDPQMDELFAMCTAANAAWQDTVISERVKLARMRLITAGARKKLNEILEFCKQNGVWREDSCVGTLKRLRTTTISLQRRQHSKQR